MNNELAFRGLLGGAEVAPKKENDILISQMTATVEKMEKVDLSKKSAGQLIKWRGGKDLAIRQFLAVCRSDKAIAEITRNDVVNFREQLQERILDKQITPHTANKYLKQVGGMYNKIRRHYLLEVANHFEGMLFPENDPEKRDAFDPVFVQDRILQDGLFDDLNPQARGVIYLMTETGLRTSEACNLLPENIVLDVEIPFVRIEPKNRTLKTKESSREIPLVGCALMAMKANPHGFPRYFDKEASLSALLNKAFAARKLFANDKQKVYSLRHTFKDRLRHVPGVFDEIINKMMGHACEEPDYGRGYTLSFKKDLLEKMAFMPPSRV